MLVYLLSLTIGITAAASSPEPGGTIHGVVVNGTQDNKPLEGVEVLLRAGPDGALAPVAETKTDRYGKFVFEQVPLDPSLVYLPGANRDGVHYPGQRARLDPSNQIAHDTIVVFDAVTAPCPLVARRHEIEVAVEQQALKITETLLVSNPTRATFVGQAMGDGPPVTLRLSIPENFDRVTFNNEFYGRHFWIVDHRPVTEIPWLPGEQELKFTYRVPLAESAGEFRRQLDVPSLDVRIRLQGANARQVSCNLPRSKETDGQWAFASVGEQLPEVFTIKLQVGKLPIPWMQYGRWGSIIVLATLAGVTVAISRLRRRPSNSQPRVGRQQLPSRQRAA